jgi:hypothetical protein
MEHHQLELPDNNKPLKPREEKISRIKKQRKRRKSQRSLIDISPNLLTNEPADQTTVQKELWAWPRLKPKKEKEPAKELDEVDTDLEEITELEQLTDAELQADDTELIYQGEEFSQELPLEEDTPTVDIPLSRHQEYELWLHREQMEDNFVTETSLADGKEALQPATADEKIDLSTAPTSGQSKASLETDISTNPETKESSLMGETANQTAADTILPPSELLDALPGSEALKTLPTFMTKLVVENTEVQASDLDYAQKPTSKLSIWQQLKSINPFREYFGNRDQQPLLQPATPNERRSLYKNHYEPSLFRRSFGLRPSVSEFVRQLKEKASLPRTPNKVPVIVDQLASSKPVESITQMFSNIQPRLVGASALDAGSMNQLLRDTPFYPGHYQKSAKHDSGINETGDVAYIPGRLNIDEEKVIPSSSGDILPKPSSTDYALPIESDSMAHKSWEEIVAIEAERLRIAGNRRPEHQATTYGAAPENRPAANETGAIQPPELPPELPPDRQVQNSVWHRIELDSRTGRAVEAPTLAYGQAFKQEQHPEMELQQPSEDMAAASGQLAVDTTAQVELRQLVNSSPLGAPEDTPSAQLDSNQVESTIRVRGNPSSTVPDLWLWVLLTIVILMLVIAIYV